MFAPRLLRRPTGCCWKLRRCQNWSAAYDTTHVRLFCWLQLIRSELWRQEPEAFKEVVLQVVAQLLGGEIDVRRRCICCVRAGSFCSERPIRLCLRYSIRSFRLSKVNPFRSSCILPRTAELLGFCYKAPFHVDLHPSCLFEFRCLRC
eukprot:SAG31_NODE_16809_length_695_cov_0.686242_1_plen_148_part_00